MLWFIPHSFGVLPSVTRARVQTHKDSLRSGKIAFASLRWQVIDGEGANQGVSISSGPVSLEGLNVTGCTARNGAGISVTSATVTVTSCSIFGNTAISATMSSMGGGAYAVGSSSVVTFNDCHVFSNTAGDNGGGLYFKNCDQVTVSNCKIYSNQANRVTNGGVSQSSRLGRT